jgi:hypothetical protein
VHLVHGGAEAQEDAALLGVELEGEAARGGEGGEGEARRDTEDALALGHGG